MALPQPLPAPGAPMVEADGRPTLPWVRFFLALWQRTGAAGGPPSGDLVLDGEIMAALEATGQAAGAEPDEASLAQVLALGQEPPDGGEACPPDLILAHEPPAEPEASPEPALQPEGPPEAPPDPLLVTYLSLEPI